MRYRPALAADLEAHGAMLALLARDLADIAPQRLERAIQRWVLSNRFMPRASELVDLCRQEQDDEDRKRGVRPGVFNSPEHLGAQYNAAMNARGGRDDIEWTMVNGEPKLRYKRPGPYNPSNPDQIDPAERDRLNWGLRHAKARFRFDARGLPFTLLPGADDPTIPAKGPYRAGGNGFSDE